jgi:hypothetical protein
MKLCHTAVLKEPLVELLHEIYDIHSHTPAVVNLSTSLARTLKCIELNVKLLLKMNVQFEAKVNEENFIATVKLTLSTNCTSLRKTHHFWNDNEIITIRLEMNADHFEYLAEKIIEHLDFFKICNVCRILYKDPRDIPATSICKHCSFDRIFHIEETTCAICQELITPDTQTFALTCAHVFHSNCILTQFIKNDNRICPLCREMDDHQI